MKKQLKTWSNLFNSVGKAFFRIVANSGIVIDVAHADQSLTKVSMYDIIVRPCELKEDWCPIYVTMVGEEDMPQGVLESVSFSLFAEDLDTFIRHLEQVREYHNARVAGVQGKVIDGEVVDLGNGTEQ